MLGRKNTAPNHKVSSIGAETSAGIHVLNHACLCSDRRVRMADEAVSYGPLAGNSGNGVEVCLCILKSFPSLQISLEEIFMQKCDCQRLP